MTDLKLSFLGKKACAVVVACAVCGSMFLSLPSNADTVAQFKYDNHGKRDPFVPLVGLSGRGTGKTREILSIDDVEFQGIARNDRGFRIVIVNGEMLEEGATLDALEVIRISDKEALVKISGREYTLNIDE